MILKPGTFSRLPASISTKACGPLSVPPFSAAWKEVHQCPTPLNVPPGKNDSSFLLAPCSPSYFVVAIRITVTELFDGIAYSRAAGLSAVAWDARSMWSQSADFAMLQKTGDNEAWIARSADLQTRSSAFDRSASSLHQIVSARHGYFEDLRTESRSGFGRALVAELAVPSDEFDATLAELQTLGRVEAVSQAGEDSAVKLASASRRVAAAQTSLSRLQKLQRERKGELRDAVALEKDIAQAAETVAETERVQENLQSTVAQAHIRFTLLEDYRAPFHPSMGSSALQIRNSFAEGISAAFSTAALFLSVLFSYGLPLMFWLALLFWLARFFYRRFRGRTAALLPVA
jgi:hypothetical protein